MNNDEEHLIIGDDNDEEDDEEEDYDEAEEEIEYEPGAEMTPPSTHNSAQMPVVMSIKTKTVNNLTQDSEQTQGKASVGSAILLNKPRAGHMKSPSGSHGNQNLLLG